MTSVFTRVVPSWPVAKASFSSQEWCGHVYHQLLPRAGRAEGLLHSYFDGEADAHDALPLPDDGLFEDALPIALRGWLSAYLPPGLQEATARRQGLRFRVHKEGTSGWYSSRRIAEDCSGFKVLIEEETERILGAHLLGPHAEDTINLFALAIRSGLRTRDLKQTIFAYPTHASDVGYML